MEILCQNETTQKQLRISENPIGNVKNDSMTDTQKPNVKESVTPIIKIGRVYLITNLINNKKYVGVTTRTLIKRFEEHCHSTKTRPYRLIGWAIQKYGKENFKIELIREFHNILEDDLFLKESFYIKKYNTFVDNKCGYNLTTYKKGKLTVSESTRRKIGISNKGKRVGNKHPMWGKIHSQEIREKISLAVKGKQIGKNHPMYGKRHSEETKRKISLAGIGKWKPENCKNLDIKIRTFENVITGETFKGTQREFRQIHKINKSGLTSLLSGRLKTIQKWKLISKA